MRRSPENLMTRLRAIQPGVPPSLQSFELGTSLHVHRATRLILVNEDMRSVHACHRSPALAESHLCSYMLQCNKRATQRRGRRVYAPGVDQCSLHTC
jgi:hypothetical protein